MATSETQFQSELVDAFKAKGMHAFKASHREKTGVLDIYCRTEKQAIWIECKWMKIAPNFQTEKISLTRPQWAFARDEIKAGGVVAKIIGYRRQTSGHDVHGLLICDPRNQATQVTRAWVDEPHHPAHIIKARGASWPADAIVGRIWTMHTGLTPWAPQERN